jgi:uncharacterized protein
VDPWTLRSVYVVHTVGFMEFEWDESKAAGNVVKHGVDFADAATVLFDEMALTISDDSSGQTRLVSLGEDALGRLLVVVYVLESDGVARLISARPATRRERRQYEGAS